MTLPSASAHHPRLPSAGDCVLRLCLARLAISHPDRVFAVFASGECWSYAQLHERVRAVAANLQTIGVRPGCCVQCWLPNGPQALLLLFAVNYLGAVFAPMSVEYKGILLDNAMRASGASILVAHATLLARLDAQALQAFERVVVVAAPSPPAGQGRLMAWEELAADGPPLQEALLPHPQPWDVHALVATSGTTGASKFVPITYAQTWATSGGFIALTGDDRALLNIPISHVGGIGVAFRALYRGGSVGLVESFSAASFWSTVCALEITTLTLLGAMTDFLLAEPARESDRQHPLRHAIMVPITHNATAFSQRFGVDIYTVFNMTEVSCPIVSDKNPKQPGSCGRAREGYELRLADGNDCEVARGDVGELLVRSDMPWAIASEYRGDPQATANAWRNGWFHTGDRFRQDDEGCCYFVDRLKGAIRRRGENISAVEVEAALAAFPAVREAAVIGVPSERGEDEVLAVLSQLPGSDIDRIALVQFLAERLPHFMVPRYLRIVDELPKTASLKVLKAQLRDEGITADTWDREREGLRLRRTRFDSHTSRRAA